MDNYLHEDAIAKNERGWTSYPRNATSGACSGLQTGFYAKRASCDVRYSRSFFQTEPDENDIRLTNIEKELIYCKNDVDYIKRFIEHIKDKVIKKCKNLNSVKIMLATFDKNNLFHKMIVVIANMMQKILQIEERANIYKSIFVVIEYEGQNVFMGGLNFSGLD
jgi:hypothetical protein